MSEQTTPVITPPTIIRNEVYKEMSLLTFSKKSDLAGKTVFGPQIFTASFDNDVKWTGQDYVIAALNAALKIEAGDIHSECIDPQTGLLNETERNARLADFTAGFITLTELKANLNDLLLKQQENSQGLISLVTAGKGNDDTEVQTLMGTMKELSDSLTPLRGKIASKEQEFKARIAKREANAAAAEAKAKADQEAAKVAAAQTASV